MAILEGILSMLGRLFLTSTILLVVLGLVLHWLVKKQQMPPGPLAIPYIGTPSVYLSLARGMTDLYNSHVPKTVERYGPIFTWYFGPVAMVVLNDYKSVKEALVTQGASTSDRPQGNKKALINPHRLGILDAPDSERFRVQRKLAISTLRSFGMGRRSFEKQIHEELQYLIGKFNQFDKKPFDDSEYINNSISNIICSLVFGQRFDYEYQDFHHILRRMEEYFKYWQGEPALEFFPVLRYVLPRCKRYVENYRSCHDELASFITGQINSHESTRDAENPRDLIDVCLHEMESKDDPCFDAESILFWVLDLFAGGTETTTTTLRWALLFMANNPEVQHKVQAELDQVVGEDEYPSLAHKPEMPYTEATVHEVLRLARTLPFTLAHIATSPVVLGGYTLPKGTPMMANIQGVLMDPQVWADPETFRPERFLDDRGQFQRREEWIPFSLGRRNCIGEQLAKMELFLFFAALLQQFTFSPPDGMERLPEEAQFQITRLPANHEILINRRF